MLNKFEKAFFDVVAGRVIFLVVVLAGAVINAVCRGHANAIPEGGYFGIVAWAVLAYGLARRRRRTAENQRRLHA